MNTLADRTRQANSSGTDKTSPLANMQTAAKSTGNDLAGPSSMTGVMNDAMPRSMGKSAGNDDAGNLTFVPWTDVQLPSDSEHLINIIFRLSSQITQQQALLQRAVNALNEKKGTSETSFGVL